MCSRKYSDNEYSDVKDKMESILVCYDEISGKRLNIYYEIPIASNSC